MMRVKFPASPLDVTAASSMHGRVWVPDSRPILSFARANRPVLRQGIAILRRLTRLKEATDRGIIPRVTPSLEELPAAGI